MNRIEFYEVQRFRIRWAWATVIAINLLFIYAILQQLAFGKPFGNKPVSDLSLVLIELAPLALLIFLLAIKLRTQIDDIGIHYRFFPFQWKTSHIKWDELRDTYIREYNSFHEFGGWGIRTGSPKTGKAINTSESGKLGLQLKFRNGKLLLIGTKRPEEIQRIINALVEDGRIARI